MANGYIGKISAVVTANTSDLSRKLSGATADVDKFANSVNASLTRLEKSGAESLNKLFTPLQNLERKFKAALDFNIRTEESVAKLRQIVSVSEGINKPLSQAATAFSRLTLEVQGSFLPALNRAQDSVLLLNRKVNETGSVSAKAFGIVERIVARTASAIQRLGEAQRLVSSGPNANSLSLTAPRVSQTLQASAAARQQAAQLPASELADGRVARQVGNLSAVENRIAEVQGRIESLQLRPKVDTVQLEAARRELDRLLAGAERIRAGIQVRIDAQKAIADTASLSERLDQLQENANFSITGTPQNLRQVEAELGRVLGQIDSLEESQRQPIGAQFTQVLDALRAGNLSQAIQGFQSLEASVKLAANETERLARANKLLAIAPGQSPPPSPSTPLGDRLQQAGADRIRGLVGSTSIDSTPALGVFNQQSQRDIDALASRVGAVRQQLETLPNSLRTQFIPALQQAQQELIALQNAPGATVAEIENAANAVQRLERNAQRVQSALNFRTQFGGEGIEGLNRGLDEQAVRGYAAQIQLLQQTIGRVSAEAAGPGVAAQDRLRNAIASAMEDGTIRTARQRQEIERLTAEAVEATAAVSGVGAGGLGRQVQRVGDVGRAGFDRFTLGVNQAVFAIDDFFSVTGGIEQRLRAIGNNVTQLGFLVGGTAGLITALGAVLIGQGLAAYIRFANGGATAEQQSKLLNDALARQKSLVEELAQAFRALGDTLANRVFSEPAQEARRLGRDIEDISKKQRELNRERVAGLDPGVQASRIRQRVLQEEFDNETDPGRRIALQRQINAARQQERRAADAAVARRPTADEVASAVERGVIAFRSGEVTSARGDAAFDAQRRIRRDAAAAAAAVPRGQSIEDVRAQIRALEETATQAPAGTGTRLFGFFGERDRAGRTLAEIQQLINALEAPLRQAIDDLSNRTSRASFAAASEIEAAQGDVADAIRRGVRGAADFQAALDNTANQLAEAQSQLAAAQEIEDLGQRETAVRRAEDRVRDVGLRLDAINERAREVRLGRGFGGERTTAALSALSGERFINEEAGLRARLRAAIDAEEQARRAVEAAIQRGDEAARDRATKDLEAAQAASDLAAAAAEAAVAIEQAFSRLRKAAENIVSQSEQLADNAQSALDTQDQRAPGAVNRDELTRERDEAERQLIQDRRRQRELQNRLDRERAEAANDPRVAVIDGRLELLRSEREDAAANARLNGVQENPRAAERRENEIARLEAEREEAVRQQTAETRRLIDQENQLIATRRRAAEEIQRQREFEAEVARRRNPQGDAVRGLDLLETPGERAARELAQNLADINEAVDREVERILGRAGGRPQDAQQELADLGARAEDARRRAREDMLRSVAPAIFGLADEVQNSILQGPSRAALGATDASTVEGQRELNRLLRGDDSNREVDLVELQKQSNRLLETIADNTGKENQVAN